MNLCCCGLVCGCNVNGLNSCMLLCKTNVIWQVIVFQQDVASTVLLKHCKGLTCTMLSGGPGETGCNTNATEHNGYSSSTDRGASPFEEEQLGADSTSFDPSHTKNCSDKADVSASIYGYEDYTGGAFHSSKSCLDTLSTGLKSISVPADVKRKEYYQNFIKAEAVGCEKSKAGFPDSEPANAIYLTLDVSVAHAKILVGLSTDMGDTKSDQSLSDYCTIDSAEPGKTGEKGADSSTTDLINVEAFGPAKFEILTGLVSD